MPDRAVDGLLWLVSLFLFVTILFLSLGRPPDVPGLHFEAADKVGHMIAYGALTFSLLLAAVWRPGRTGRTGDGLVASAWAVVGGVLVFGGAVELVQLTVHRNGDVLDLMADAIGALIATGLWRLLQRRAERRLSQP